MKAMSTKQIIGFFDDEEKLLEAVRKIKENAIVIKDIYMPYPVQEAIEAVGKKSQLPAAAYFLGLAGVILVLWFLYYTSVIDWPIDYGGKPFNSFPSFIVVTIVLTIFTITIGSLFLFSVRAKLFPGKREKLVDMKITDDRFAMVIQADNETIGKIHEILNQSGVIEIRE
jgi:hypothetical protein